MAWIETHQSVMTHRKTLKAATVLKLAPVHVVGHLVSLWLWALDNAQDGHVGESERIIAKAAHFEGSPKTFVKALEGAGYLSPNGHGWTLHDWDDYAGKLLARREANKERMKAARVQHVQRTNETRVKNVQTRVELPNRTVPNSTEPRSKAKSANEPRQEKPRTPTETQAFLLQKLVDRDPRWDELWGLLTKLNAQMTRPIVTTALQHLVESDSPAGKPAALLVDTCKRIREEQAS